MKILSYGSASMHKNRKNNNLNWRNQCYELSEKQNADFFELNGKVFCTYTENGKPKTVKLGTNIKRKKNH